MTRLRSTFVAIAVVAAYLGAVAVTTTVRHDDARPLYDGFAPPSSYRFVDPPSFFSTGNVKPQAMSTTIALGPHGSRSAGFATPDGQFVVSLGTDAIPPAAGATSIAVRITPLAPRHLGPVPGALRPNGNAYRVEMTYQPTGAPVPRFTHAGTLLLQLPELGTSLFASPDATTWSTLPARTIPPGQLSMSANFASAGYYLAATSLPELAAQPARARRSAIRLGLVTAAAALALFAAAFVVVRRRRAAPL